MAGTYASGSYELFLPNNELAFFLILRDSKAQVQIPEANLTDSANHEYEVIDKYTKEYRDVVEMDLTKCPAYEPMRT